MVGDVLRTVQERHILQDTAIISQKIEPCYTHYTILNETCKTYMNSVFIEVVDKKIRTVN